MGPNDGCCASPPRGVSTCVLHRCLSMPVTGSAAELRWLLRLCENPWFDFWRRDVTPLQLKRSLLVSAEWGPPPRGVAEGFKVFVDGSERRGKAGFGLVLFGWHCGAWCYIGWSGGAVFDPGFCTNNGAERSALLLAACWAFSLPTSISIEIVADSSYAINCATGLSVRSQPCEDNPVLKLRQVMQIHEQRRKPLWITWTKSHSGTLGNELADRAADYFREHQGCAPPIPHCVNQLLKHTLRAWGWVISADADDMPDFNQLAQGVYERCDPLPIDCVVQVLQDADNQHAGRVASVNIKVCTANVCTLKNKGAILRKQLQCDGISLCALQETRLASDCVYMSEGWVIVHAAALKGQDGVAIWINAKALAVKLQLPLGFGVEAVTVLQAHPDWLAIRLQVAGLDLVLVSYHGPHSEKSEECIAGWWATAMARLRELEDVAPIMFLGDPNAQVANHVSETVGQLAGDNCNVAGECLTAACERFGLALLNTFPSAAFEDNMPMTWKGRKCLDYVGIPMSWLRAAETVHCSVDLCNKHEDHEALCFVVNVSCKRDKNSHCKAGRDCPKPHFSIKMNRFKSPEWEVNVHEHAALILRRAGCEQMIGRGSRPIKPFVTQETWDLLRWKKQCKKRLNEVRRAANREDLHFYFLAWKGAPKQLYRGPDWKVKLLLGSAKKHSASLAVAKGVHQDKLAYIQHVAAQVKDGADSKQAEDMYHALRFFRPGGRKTKSAFRALPILRHRDGSTACSFHEQQQIKASHFGNLEAAEAMNAEAIVQAYEESHAGRDNSDFVFDVHDLPTLFQLEQLIAAMPKDRAPGPSKVKNGIWLECVPWAARLWFPVVLKSHVRLCEPFSFSTSLLFTLYKGLGPHAAVESHRSIFLLEGLGKCSHKLMRPHVMKILERRAPSLFHGCKRESNSQALTHYIVLWMRVAKLHKWSSGLLFLDISSAFYRVVRCKLLGGPWHDALTLDILKQMGAQADLFRDIMAWCCGEKLVDDMRPHHRRVLQSYFAVTSFVVPGVPEFQRSRSGTRPGDAIADCLFGIVMADALISIRNSMQEQGLSDSPVQHSDPCQPVGADDAVLPFGCVEASSLLTRARSVCSIAHRECARRALQLNYKKGKTEIMLSFHGQGAVKCRQAAFLQGGGVDFEANGQDYTVRKVHEYVHLGTTITDNGTAILDLKRKLGRGVSAVRPLARRVLRQEHVGLRDRVNILRGTGMGTAHHNVAVWGPLNDGEMHTWIQGHDQLVRLLRPDDRSMGSPSCPSVLEACGAVELAPPQALLSGLRLCHAWRLVAQELVPIWTLLEVEDATCDRSWLGELRVDLARLKYWVPHVVQVQPASLSSDELAVWLSEHDVRTHIKKAMRAQALSLKRWHVFQLQARNSQLFHGVQHDRRRDQLDDHLACHLCTYVCRTGAQLAGHLAAQHDHVSPARWFATGTTCRACLRQFWSRKRLCNHLARGPCLAFLATCCAPEVVVSAVEVERAQDADVDVQRAPVVRKAGPLRAGGSPDNFAVLFLESDLAEKHLLGRSGMLYFKEKHELMLEFIQVSLPERWHKGPTYHGSTNPDGHMLIQQASIANHI